MNTFGALLRRWPVVQQVLGRDSNESAISDRTRAMHSRLEGAKAVASVCPYCAVGCGTLAHVKDGKVIDVEGNPASPINEGTLCPKGAATFQYAVNPNRLTTALYRRPYGTEWEVLELDRAMEMVADRVLAARSTGWEDYDGKGQRLRRTRAFASLGGATLDNEENYLIKKCFSALGAIQIENQARI